MELLSEKNPRRPVATYERFQQTLETLRALAANARQRRGRRKWLRVMLALIIAEATGGDLVPSAACAGPTSISLP
jgi:hypothetical protein